MTSAEPTYEVYAPTGASASGEVRTGPALEELEGATVALLWDWYFKGDQIFELIRQDLSARYPGMRFLGPEVFGSTHGDREDGVIAELPGVLRARRVDAVISAVGA
jgi:hypothetical protein